MRCFLAIDIPVSIRSALTSVKLPAMEPPPDGGSPIRPVKPENYHITLKFYGEVNEARIAKLKSWLSSEPFSSAEIRIAGLGVFPPLQHTKENVALGRLWSPRVLWAGIHGLSSVWSSAQKSPHMTLARLRPECDSQSILSLLDEYKDRVFGSFVPDSIKLKSSVLSPVPRRRSSSDKPVGPVYEDLYVRRI